MNVEISQLLQWTQKDERFSFLTTSLLSRQHFSRHAQDDVTTLQK